MCTHVCVAAPWQHLNRMSSLLYLHHRLCTLCDVPMEIFIAFIGAGFIHLEALWLTWNSFALHNTSCVTVLHGEQ